MHDFLKKFLFVLLFTKVGFIFRIFQTYGNSLYGIGPITSVSITVCRWQVWRLMGEGFCDYRKRLNFREKLQINRWIPSPWLRYMYLLNCASLLCHGGGEGSGMAHPLRVSDLSREGFEVQFPLARPEPPTSQEVHADWVTIIARYRTLKRHWCPSRRVGGSTLSAFNRKIVGRVLSRKDP